ncbi:hypothetical protein MKW92_001756 [Papaver armeniacum]|nr:hypothetical protein MKW92_001756 [Papaver armeniacum]
MDVLILIIPNMLVWQEIPSRFDKALFTYLTPLFIIRLWTLLIEKNISEMKLISSDGITVLILIFTQYDGNSRNPGCSCKLTDHTGI